MRADKKNKLVYLCLGLVSFMVFSGVHMFGLFSGFENVLEDRMFSQKDIDNRIIIIAVDDKSLGEVGQWPWPRSVFANLFSKLEKGAPEIVGLDVMLSERSRYGVADDTTLANALQNISYKIVMPTEERDGAGKFIMPLPEFSGAGSIILGHVNFIIDSDNTVRKYPKPISEESGNSYISFSEKVAEIAGAVVEKPGKRIVYAGETGRFPRISFSDALTKDPLFFKDKIVLIGATAPDLHDEQRTPVSSGELMSGVEIQANIVNMLLRGHRLSDVGFFTAIGLILLVGLLFASAFSIFEKIKTLVWFSIIIFAVALIGMIIAFENGVVIRVADVLGAIIFSGGLMFVYKYSVAEKYKRELKNVFSKYVSPQVLSKILLEPEKVALGGEEKLVTVLFSDIRGFTSLSEATKPAELVEILNEYFTEMTNEILKCDGVLDKYIGDAIMAFWGAPIGDENQADKAVKAALGMTLRLKEFNEKMKERGKPEIKNGVGIYTGPAIVGNIGSQERFDYTVIGDTVNTASRLESATKELGATIVIGEPTKKALKETYNLRELGTIKVKGKTEELNVYSVEFK